MLEALVLITEICDYIRNNRRMKSSAFCLDNPYDMIFVLEVREYLQLLAKGGLKE